MEDTKTTKINKPVMMDKWMIDEIHEKMADHLKEKGKPISFGEASRQLIAAGLEKERE